MDTTALMIKMIFDRWNASLRNWDGLLDAMTDEQLTREIAAGKNRGIYILGHLIAVHDDMLVLLDLGERLYPDLHKPFLELPDKATSEIPDAQVLRGYWRNQCEVLSQKFATLNSAQWMEKHTAVSAEDFQKEPHRNKLNIIITRTTHLAYHTGQLVLLK